MLWENITASIDRCPPTWYGGGRAPEPRRKRAQNTQERDTMASTISTADEEGNLLQQMFSDTVASNAIVLTFDASPGKYWEIQSSIIKTDDATGDLTVESPDSTTVCKITHNTSGVLANDILKGVRGDVGQAMLVNLNGLTAAGEITVVAKLRKAYGSSP